MTGPETKKSGKNSTNEDGGKIGGIPLIFMFQPTEFVVVKGDKLREWEERMVNNVGLDRVAELKGRKFRRFGVETTSLCEGGGADDCDWFDQDLLPQS